MSVAKVKRVLFTMQYDRNEPLGVMHLQGLARQHGVETLTVLHKDGDFDPLFRMIKDFKPEILLPSLWTGIHVQCYEMAERVRREFGIPVIFGGPHVSNHAAECLPHCNIAVRGGGYRPLRRILYGEIPISRNDEPGVEHFDPEAMSEGWPAPYRDQIYRDYPEMRNDPQGNIFSTQGCIYGCTYCNSPENNRQHGGFKNFWEVQPLDQVIADAIDMATRWGKKKFYFQDDIFGFKIKEVLEPFVERWPKEVGMPFHCQMRPEMMGAERLALVRQAGCTGMSVAIESAIPFIREHVLMRKMTNEFILEAFRRAKALGFGMRSEQISMKPFDSEETDLAILLLNNAMRLDGVDMMWLTLFTAYGENPSGKIVHRMGFSKDNKDLFKPNSYYDRSWLRHTQDGPIRIEPVVRPLEPFYSPRHGTEKDDGPLLHMYARPKQPGGDIYADEVVDVYLDPPKQETSVVQIQGLRMASSRPSIDFEKPVGELQFRTPESNADYVANGVIFQRTINFLHRVPNVENLARRWRHANRDGGWTWENLGRLTEEHFREQGHAAAIPEWTRKLAEGMGCAVEELPVPIAQNPIYFASFPDGPALAQEFLKKGVFEESSPEQLFKRSESIVRGWAFHHAVSPTEPAQPRIMDV